MEIKVVIVYTVWKKEVPVLGSRLKKNRCFGFYLEGMAINVGTVYAHSCKKCMCCYTVLSVCC